jgi:hypothetical protein
MTVAQFKQEIRELDLWCSSCMVGFEGDDPVAVVIGCKRPPDTLVRSVGVHSRHLRKGHGRHLLSSLSAKLAILGPPRLLAEVPATNVPARALFEACGWAHDRAYFDLVLGDDAGGPSPPYGAFTPVTIDDVPEAIPRPDTQPAWECSAAAIEKRRERLRGLALISTERIEASALYTREDGFVSIWASHGAALAPLVREIERRENARASVLGSPIGAIPGFRRVREVLRLTTAAKPA